MLKKLGVISVFFMTEKYWLWVHDVTVKTLTIIGFSWLNFSEFLDRKWMILLLKIIYSKFEYISQEICKWIAGILNICDL